MNKKLIFGFIILVVIVLVLIIIFNNQKDDEEIVEGAIIKNPANIYEINMTPEEYNFMIQQQRCQENCQTSDCMANCYN